MSTSFTPADADGKSPSSVQEIVLAGFNGTTIDRIKTTNGQLQIAASSLTGGTGGATINANPIKGVVYQNPVPLQASFSTPVLDVSNYHTLVIDWNITTFTGTGSPTTALTISSVDEQGNLHTVNATALSFAATGSAIIYMGTGAGTLTDTGTTRRYPDPFRRKVQLVFTETTMTALTSTITIVGE